MTLRELTKELMEFIAFCENEDLDEQAIKDTFEGLEGEFEEKADAYANVRTELKSDVAKLDAEIKRLTDKKNVIENNITRINDTLMWAMNTTGKTKFKTNLFSFGIAKNGGLAPLEITGFVPEEFMTIPDPVVDNAKVREFLKDHTCDWAELKERGTHLSIR